MSQAHTYTKAKDGELIENSNVVARDEEGRVIANREGIERMQLIFTLSPDRKSVVKMTYEEAKSAYSSKDGALNGPEALAFQDTKPPVPCFDDSAALAIPNNVSDRLSSPRLGDARANTSTNQKSLTSVGRPTSSGKGDVQEHSAE